MKTYTEEQIKKYFEYLEKTFQNCRFNEAVRHVEDTMFVGIHTIDKFLGKNVKP